MATYSAKSSAHRAAKQAGLEKDQYTIVEIDGKFGYQATAEGHGFSVAEKLSQEMEEVYASSFPERKEDDDAAYEASLKMQDEVDAFDQPSRLLGEDLDLATTRCPCCHRDDQLYRGLYDGDVLRFEDQAIGCFCGWEYRSPGMEKVELKPYKEAKAEVPANGKSTVEKPCTVVWDIAEKMTKENPSVRRKDVIAECEAAGVAHYTARTQYQIWKSLQK